MTLRPAPSLMNEHVASDPEAVFVKVTLIKSLRLVGEDGKGGGWGGGRICMVNQWKTFKVYKIQVIFLKG